MLITPTESEGELGKGEDEIIDYYCKSWNILVRHDGTFKLFGELI